MGSAPASLSQRTETGMLGPFSCSEDETMGWQKVLRKAGVAVAIVCGVATGGNAADEAAAGVSGWVAKKNGTVVGRNRRSGEKYQGDVLKVVQKLADDLSRDSGGPGGTIVIAAGKYVASGEHTLEIGSGIHLRAEAPGSTRLKLADGALTKPARDGFMFVRADGSDIVIEGLVFDCNGRGNVVRSPLKKDAEKGAMEIHLEDASAFAGRGRALGIGRPHRKKPGGFRVRDAAGSERVMAKAVDEESGTIRLQFDALDRTYSTERDAEAVYYPMTGGIDIRGARYTVRNCRFVDVQESAGVRGRGGGRGKKRLVGNEVIGLHGGTAVRLHRVKSGGILRGNFIDGCEAGYNKFWGEGISIEQNEHSICTENVVRGPGDRLIRANYANHCVIANNTVRVPLVPLPPFDGSAWEPVGDDETVAPADGRRGGALVEAGKKGRAGLRVAMEKDRRDWRRYNRLHLWTRAETDGAKLRLRLVGPGGGSAVYRRRTWVGGEGQVLTFDLTDPAVAKGGFSLGEARTAELYYAKPAEGSTFRFANARLGRKTGWGVTVWGAHDTTVADNTFYGVGGNRGTIYYGQRARNLTITGNTLAYCYEGIGWAGGDETGITVSENTLYATMGGIRGDVTATDNVITYDPSNSGTKFSISARIARGNRLKKTRGIRSTGGGVVTGNRLVGYHGPGILLTGSGGTAAHNVLKRGTGTAIRQAEDGRAHLIRGNTVDGADHALALQGSDATVADNRVGRTADAAVAAAGEDTAFRDNRGLGVVSERVTLRSGQAPAGRLDGVAEDPSRRPIVRSVQPVKKTLPKGDHAIDVEPTWDGSQSDWDIVIRWETDPGEDYDVVLRVDTGPPTS